VRVQAVLDLAREPFNRRALDLGRCVQEVLQCLASFSSDQGSAVVNPRSPEALYPWRD